MPLDSVAVPLMVIVPSVVDVDIELMVTVKPFESVMVLFTVRSPSSELSTVTVVLNGIGVPKKLTEPLHLSVSEAAAAGPDG
jgi:hypothetical protein